MTVRLVSPPAGHACGHTVEGDGARALGRAEVRAADVDGLADHARIWCHREITGAATTVNVGPPLLLWPAAVITLTCPVVAPAGTSAVMLVVVHEEMDVDAVPLSRTVPWVPPKAVP
jgi:hypothetical protein